MVANKHAKVVSVPRVANPNVDIPRTLIGQHLTDRDTIRVAMCSLSGILLRTLCGLLPFSIMHIRLVFANL